jgi:single-strand DNA-binding protein
MAEGLNRVLLIGNLGRDPELRFTQSGQAVLSLRLATNESFQNKDGVRQERTEWHSVTVWGKRGEGLNKVISKGSQMYIEGRLQTRSWEDKQGQKRYSTEVVATNVILLGSRGGGAGGGSGGGGGYDGPPPPSDDEMAGGGGGGGAGGAGGGDDDIPF